MNDITNTILSRIYTTNENILGMLSNLEVIMDTNGYQELYNKYIEISKNIPINETLTEAEKKYENFGTELKYTSVDRELTKFESELEYYNDYKELSDLNNEVKNITNKAFDKNTSIEEYITKNKQFIESLIKIKNNKTIHQFTNLLNNSIENIFNSLKILSIINNNTLLEYIKELDSDYLNEHLASKIRKSINTTTYKGTLDADYLKEDVLYECANNDDKIIFKKNEAIEYEKREKIRKQQEEVYVSELFNELKQNDLDIQKYQELIKRIKSSNISIKLKKLLLKSITIPALVIPLICPFIGNSMGKKASSNVKLTKTITKTVDASSLEVISENESYEELKTTYVASITICNPWKRNMSGVSYSRDCTVYDYNIDNTNIEEDFHLTLDNINKDNLTKKYTYEEVVSDISDDLYLTNNQIYITETYQDLNDIKISDKYNIPYTVVGVGTGIIIGTTELLIYLFLLKDLLENINENLDYKYRLNESDLIDANKSLKLTLNRQKEMKEEYDSLKQKIK